MLQKLGLIKYNSNFIFKEENTKRTFPNKSFFNKSMNIQRNTKRKNISCKSLKHSIKTNPIQKEDIVFNDEINNFIEESTRNNKIKIDHSSLIKIKHNIDDNIIKRNNLKLDPSFRTQQNINRFKFNDYTIYNLINKKNKKKEKQNIAKDSRINLIYNLNKDFNIKNEINEKKMLIKNLEINNESLENKINILKNEYNTNLLNNTDINTDYNKNLINLKYMKSNTTSNCNDLLLVKKDLIELKNKIYINSKEQKIINLMLIKETMENELNKEDINKTNKLIENINKEIEHKKNQISEIRKKSKLLLALINLNIVPDDKNN